MASQVFMVSSNKTPCEVPKTIRVPLAAGTPVSETIDLSEYVSQGLIDNVQGVFVDNLDGPALTIECNVTRQRVRVAAGAQMVIQLLCTNAPRFAIEMAAAGKTVFHFVNFPVMTQVY